MVINFRTREISREACKLTQTPMLIIKKKRVEKRKRKWKRTMPILVRNRKGCIVMKLRKLF